MTRHARQRTFIGGWLALVVALAVLSAGATLGFLSASEAQGANSFAGATFSPSTAPVPTAVNQTPGSNSVLLTWSPVTLSDTSNGGSIAYNVVRSDGNTVCTLVATTLCTDTTGTAGTNYRYTEEAFYVVGASATWSLGPSAASNQVTFPGTPSFTTTLVQPGSTAVGNSWSDFATVTGNTNGGAPTGTVTFSFCQETSPPNTPCTGGTTVATLTAPTSTAGDVSTYTPSDTETPTVGTYCYNASYAATAAGNYSSVAQQTDTECFTVTPAAPSSFVTNLSLPVSTTLGNSWNDAAVVTGNSTGGAPTGSVAFTFCTESSGPCTGGTTVATVSTASTSGDASTFTLPSNDAQMPMTTGTYCYNASYTATPGGNYASAGSQSDTECFTVTPATPSNVVTNAPTSPTLGQSVTFTATVIGPLGVAQPTGTVTWSVTGSAGASSCTTSTTTLSVTFKATCTINPLSNAGTYIVSDTYNGDGNYTTATSSADTLSVAQVTPNNVVTNIPPTPTLGQSVTFTATVTGPPGATAPTGGTVTWTVSGPGGINSCTTSSTPTLNGSSQATCVLTVASAGTYSVSDSWGGNSNYNTATSSADTVTVAKATPSESVTNNTVTAGGTLVFTATVTGPTGGATPSGTMGWSVTPPGGGSIACSSSTGPTALLNVATYTCSINSVVDGTYSATALYPGDSNYNLASGSDSTTIPTASVPTVTATYTYGTNPEWTDGKNVTLTDFPTDVGGSGVASVAYYYCPTSAGSCTASTPWISIGSSLSSGSNWSVGWTVPLNGSFDGTYNVLAIATGNNGNVSSPSSTIDVGIDTTPPTVSPPSVNGIS